jgi:hypothetical protein
MAKAPKPVKLTSVLRRSKTGWYFLDVPAGIAKRFETDPKTRRVVCTLNGEYSFQCALSPNKGVFTIGVNTEIRKKLGLNAGDEIAIRLEQDTSRYGAPIPEDFEEVLRQDPEGDRLFHALTGGMQRSLLYLIGSVKNIDRRIHLGLIVLEHLKENNGKVIGKRLQEDITRPIF